MHAPPHPSFSITAQLALNTTSNVRHAIHKSNILLSVSPAHFRSRPCKHLAAICLLFPSARPRQQNSMKAGAKASRNSRGTGFASATRSRFFRDQPRAMQVAAPFSCNCDLRRLEKSATVEPTGSRHRYGRYIPNNICSLSSDIACKCEFAEVK